MDGRKREEGERKWMVRRNGKKRGRDTVGGSHTNYLRKRFFEYQLGFGPQSLDRGAAPFLGKGINFVTCQVKSSGRTATLVEHLPRSITDTSPFPSVPSSSSSSAFSLSSFES